MHTHKHEKNTGYYLLVSYDVNNKEIGKSTFLNFTKDYVEPYQIKQKKRRDWCYVHNEEMECRNEDGDHDYYCRKCEEKCTEDLKKYINQDLKNRRG